jgi:hypothetical protein
MKFFLDTEFIERGPDHPVVLISIAVVREDGVAKYWVSADFDADDASDWVKANVLPHIEVEDRYTNVRIASELRDFIGAVKPEFWGYYADYDWVVTSQLFGTMMDLPDGWPMYCNDLKQWCNQLGNPELPKQNSTEHNALADARWNKIAHEFLSSLEAKCASGQGRGRDGGSSMSDETLFKQKDRIMQGICKFVPAGQPISDTALSQLMPYVGVCKGDKELTDTVLPMARAALAPRKATPVAEEER